MAGRPGNSDDNDDNVSDGNALIFQGPTPLARLDEPRPTASLTLPVYASPVLSPPVLVSDTSKSGATAAVAAVKKNPKIEVK